MITEAELAREIANIKEQMGTVINHRACMPVDSGERQYIFKTLIETLKVRYGMSEEDFSGPMIVRVIQDGSVNPKSEKLNGWKNAVRDDWNRAIAAKFPREIIAHDPSTEVPKQKYERKQEYEQVDEDPRIAKENLIDPAIFEGMPPVVDPDDEEFLKMLKSV